MKTCRKIILLFVIYIFYFPCISFAEGKSVQDCETENIDIDISKRQAHVMKCLLGESYDSISSSSEPVQKGAFKNDGRFCKSNKNSKCSPITDGAGWFDDVQFEQFSDGSAWVAAQADHNYLKSDSRWAIACKRDAMTQRKSCHATLGDLWIYIDHAGKIIVSVGVDHYPGSQTSIRLGSRRFDTLDRDGDFSQSLSIIQAMKDGQIIVTRFMKWPYRQWIDQERVLYGSQATIAMLRWTIANLR